MALASKRLNSQAIKSAVCPFAQEMCTALQLDSGYLNSDRHLGMNAPPKDQLYFRIVTTWTPESTILGLGWMVDNP
jgi:hypothetical protein